MNGTGSYEGLRVGFVLFVAMIILVAGLYAIAFRPTVVGDMAYFTTYFGETGGLRNGAPVWIGGVEVGSVRDVAFAVALPAGNEAKEIEVILAVGRRFAGRIRDDSVCRVKTRGLLGEKIVTIHPGTSGHAVIAEGGAIPSEDGGDLEDAIATAGAGVDRTAAAAVMALEELRRILVDIRMQQGILGKLIYSDEFYRDTIGRIDKVVDEATKELANLSTTLQDEVAQLREDGSRTLAAVEEEVHLASAEFRDSLSKLRADLGEVGALARDIRQGKGTAGMLVADAEVAEERWTLIASLDSTVAHFASVSAKIDGGEGTLGALVNDASAYTSMRDLFEGVRESWLLRSAVRDAEETGRELRITRWNERQAKEVHDANEKPSEH